MRCFSLHCDVCTAQAPASPRGWIAFREVGLAEPPLLSLVLNRAPHAKHMRLILIPFEQPEVEMDPQMGCVCGLECLGRLVFGWGGRLQGAESELNRLKLLREPLETIPSYCPGFYVDGRAVTPAEAQEWLAQGVDPNVDPIHELGRLARPDAPDEWSPEK